MDNLTHSLVAVAMARAGLNRFSAHGTAILVIAANLPDIDVVSLAAGDLAYLDLHRNLTHGVQSAPILALLPMLLFRYGLRRPVPVLGAWLISVIGVLSHLGLDFVTHYGTRLASPFSQAWYQWPVLFIFDSVLAAVLLLSVAAPALSKLVSGEIGAKPGSGRGWAIFALLFTGLWIGGRGMVKTRVEELLTSRVQQGVAPRRVLALPTTFSPVRWRGLVETDGFYSVHDVNLLFSFDPEAGQILSKPQQIDVLRAARRAPALARFLAFSQWPVYRIVPLDEPPGGQRVQVFDLRFSSDGSAFRAVVDLDAGGRVLRDSFQMRP
ncbi:MAG: metal-dependent hydrolase [Bryobacteraceae bacterium]|nr:metal-dependent hydrolase [Bryobacteraceae bacterium]